jgi:hypothetical protein
MAIVDTLNAYEARPPYCHPSETDKIAFLAAAPARKKPNFPLIQAVRLSCLYRFSKVFSYLSP